jgi:ATP-dependent Clp protease ATP-binding subunit ClpB
LQKQLEKANIHLVVSQDAKDFIARTGYDPQFGARPIKRVIQQKVLNELSKQILANKLDKTKPVVMDVFDDQVVFRAPVKNEIEAISLN